MSRIGVFICHCGHNIAGTVDVEELAKRLRGHPDVAFSVDYKYMCSDPGQELIRKAIQEQELDGVVVAACSPAMHETTFRRTSASAGINAYRCESANIREQVSWVHQQEKEAATRKAEAIMRSIVEKVKQNEALEPLRLPLTRRCLVIGGGIAGMQAACDIADAGYPVILVERSDHLGGKMVELSGTYLNLQDGQALLRDRIKVVQEHPNIQVLLRSEVRALSGYVGNFEAKVEAVSEAGPEEFTFDLGAVVVATGWDRFDAAKLPEYGGGAIPDVVDTLAFEGMLASPDGVRCPSDGRIPRRVVFVQCAGSRDRERGVPYCSKVCCMVVAKQAMAYQRSVPDGQAMVFYIDIRSAGKGYEEYVQRAMSQSGVLYLRGKVSKVFEEEGQVKVWGVDTLSDQPIEVKADLVVLATPMVANAGAADLGQTLRISSDASGFFNEAHPKLRPVETLTAGVFLGGTCQSPKDIPETVAQASGAAAKVLQLFSQAEMVQSPTVAAVIQELCAGCGICVATCPYKAREIHPVWQVATVNAALCQNCGACVVACPNKACYVRNWHPSQITAMVSEIL
jgi:heterodisulfide reductase subunit A